MPDSFACLVPSPRRPNRVSPNNRRVDESTPSPRWGDSSFLLKGKSLSVLFNRTNDGPSPDLLNQTGERRNAAHAYRRRSGSHRGPTGRNRSRVRSWEGKPAAPRSPRGGGMEHPGITRSLIAFDEIIPPRGGTAFTMRAGQVCRVVDLEGKQVADFICFHLRDLVDKLSPENTQLLNGTLFLTTGHHLYSTKATRLMTIAADTCGVHDLISGSCSEYTNAFRHGVRGTPNCRTNSERALRPDGLPPAD